MVVTWFEAEVEQRQFSQLAVYDHYRFPLGGRAAVLITYVQAAAAGSQPPTLLAVQHGAAEQHPALPDRLLELVGTLRWLPTTSPPPT